MIEDIWIFARFETQRRIWGCSTVLVFKVSR